MRRSRCALTCLALAASAVAVPAAAAPCGAATAARRGEWFVAKPPPLKRPAPRALLTGDYAPVRAVAVDPGDARVVFVTDGAHLRRSDDGGCTWRVVHALAAAPATPDDTGDIRSIDVVRVGGKPRVLLAVDGSAGTPFATRTALVRSDDGATGWTTTSDATFAGTYDTQRGPWAPVVRSAGTVAYAAVPAANGTVAYVRSTDGGRTWTTRTSPADPAAPVRMTGFAVNPWQPDELWEWGGRWSRDGTTTTALRRSTDGGATWTWLDPWPSYDDQRPTWVSADVAWPRRGGPARVVVLGEAPDGSLGAAPVVAWSGDGGAAFRIAVPPVRIKLSEAAVAHLPNGDTLVVAGDRAAFRIAHGARPPLRADWRALPPAPEPAAFATAGYDLARAGATSPAVLAVPTADAVQLLVVRR